VQAILSGGAFSAIAVVESILGWEFGRRMRNPQQGREQRRPIRHRLEVDLNALAKPARFSVG